MSKQSGVRIVYIAGFGRNGGTLLDRILGQIPSFFSLGEFRFVWQKGVLGNELCNCGAPFRECDFWKRVFEKAFDGFDERLATEMMALYRHTDRSRYLPLLLSPWKPSWFLDRCREYVATLEKLLITIREESGCSVLIDSSKFAGYGLILGMLPNASLYVVHLVRDSRATAYSWQKRKRKPEVWYEVRHMKRYPLWRSALQWMYLNAGAELLRGRSEGYIFVRYEDFVCNPRRILRSILHLVGESQKENELPLLKDHVVRLGKTHTQSGNPGRFRHGDVQISLDDGWMKQIGRGNQIFVTAMTWPLLIRYGYPLRPLTAED